MKVFLTSFYPLLGSIGDYKVSLLQEDQKEIKNKEYREPPCKGPRVQSNGLEVPVVSKNHHGKSEIENKNGKSPFKNGLMTSDQSKAQKVESKAHDSKTLTSPKESKKPTETLASKKTMESKLSVEPKVPSESNKVKTQDKILMEPKTPPKECSNGSTVSLVPMDDKLSLGPSVTEEHPEPTKTKSSIAPVETSTTPKAQNANENDVSHEPKSTLKVSQDTNVSRSKTVSPLIPNDPWEYYEQPKNEENPSEDLNKEVKEKAVEDACLIAEAKNKAEEVGRHKVEVEAKNKAKKEVQFKAEAEAEVLEQPAPQRPDL